MSDESLITELNTVTEGLLYPSECDEPFKAFSWPGTSEQNAQQAVEAHTGDKLPVVEQAVS